MDQHVRALGWAYIVYGAVMAVLSLAALIWFGSLSDAWAWAEASGGFGPLFVGFLLAHVLLGIPMIVGGVYLLRLEEWARMMMVIVSALNVLNIPLGSALGAYGLWVLLTPESEPLFVDPIFKSKSGGSGRHSQMPRNLPSGSIISVTESPGNSGSAKERSVNGIPPVGEAIRTNLPE